MPKAANLKKFSYVIAILFGCLFAARKVYADPILATEYPNYLIETAIALFLALVVESTVIGLLYFKNEKIMLALLKGQIIGNLISVPIVNILIIFNNLTALPLTLYIIFLEMIAIVIDAFFMFLFARNLVSTSKMFLISLLMNVLSFFLAIFTAGASL